MESVSICHMEKSDDLFDTRYPPHARDPGRAIDAAGPPATVVLEWSTPP